MNKSKWLAILPAAIFAMLAAAPSWADDMAQFMPEVVQKDGMTYMTGGVGIEERDAMKSAAKDYNLAVSNANKGGHFSADITLVIKGKDGKEVLMVQDAGPLFYAKLPAGSYALEAMNGDQQAKRRFTIAGHKRAQVHLIWSNGVQCNGAKAEAAKEAVKEEPKGAVKHMRKGKAKKAPAEATKETPKDEKSKDAAKDVKKDKARSKKAKAAPKDEKAKEEKAKEAPKETPKEAPKAEEKKPDAPKDATTDAPKEEPKTETKDM